MLGVTEEGRLFQFLLFDRFLDNATESIELNYTAYDRHLDTIWYNLDGGTNITLTGNITFNTSNGDHVLHIYVNDSNGNLDNSYVEFTVTNELIVTLNSPTDNSLNCVLSHFSPFNKQVK